VTRIIHAHFSPFDIIHWCAENRGHKIGPGESAKWRPGLRTGPFRFDRDGGASRSGDESAVDTDGGRSDG
jgi:hypothetical protein